MNLPEKFNFNLALAKLGWPLIARDGHKCRFICDNAKGRHPVVILHSEGALAYICHHQLSGKHSFGADSKCDPFLSSDLTNADVRAAVKRCHEAGMEIGRNWRGFDEEWRKTETILWSWETHDYLPACLISELQTEPEYRKVEHDEGFGKLHSAAWWQACCFKSGGVLTAWTGGSPATWGDCHGEIYTRLTREELAALDGPKYVQWSWGDDGLPLNAAGEWEGKPVRIIMFPDGVILYTSHHVSFTNSHELTYAEALEQVTVNGKPFGREVAK